MEKARGTGRSGPIDMNGDGIGDVVSGRRTSHETIDTAGRRRLAEGVDVGVSLRRPSGEEVKLLRAPGVVHGFRDAYRVFSCTTPDIRFHQSGGLASFRTGQTAAKVGEDGAVIAVLRLDGFAVGARLVGVDIAMQPTVAPSVDSMGRVIRWAYQEGAAGGIADQGDVNQLVWVLRDEKKGSWERIDPNRWTRGQSGSSPTPAEILLKPLFLKAQEFSTKPGVPKTPQEKKVMIHRIRREMAQWRVHAQKTDQTRAKAIANDPALWEGIRHALGKLAGLQPADFPG